MNFLPAHARPFVVDKTQMHAAGVKAAPAQVGQWLPELTGEQLGQLRERFDRCTSLADCLAIIAQRGAAMLAMQAGPDDGTGSNPSSLGRHRSSLLTCHCRVSLALPRRHPAHFIHQLQYFA